MGDPAGWLDFFQTSKGIKHNACRIDRIVWKGLEIFPNKLLILEINQNQHSPRPPLICAFVWYKLHLICDEMFTPATCKSKHTGLSARCWLGRLAGLPVEPERAVGRPMLFMQFDDNPLEGLRSTPKKIALTYDMQDSAMTLFNRLNRTTGQPTQPPPSADQTDPTG
jgi:hypothetical protein